MFAENPLSGMATVRVERNEVAARAVVRRLVATMVSDVV